MQFSPRSVFLSFRSKYPPQHSVLKNPQQHNWQNYSFVYFNPWGIRNAYTSLIGKREYRRKWENNIKMKDIRHTVWGFGLDWRDLE
jgi:hypothetical protein